MWRLILVAIAMPAQADSLVATRMIRAQTVISAADVVLVASEIPGALADPAQALGLEARVAIYPGRALRAEDLGPPAQIARNQLVTLIYRTGPLRIAVEGRALARGGAGDAIRVMNLASRNTVTGRIEPDGTVIVGP
ncbi:MAG: flagellar basal body P-ring formation chaperone FlgA [Paracoccaceae bacterium]